MTVLPAVTEQIALSFSGHKLSVLRCYCLVVHCTTVDNGWLGRVVLMNTIYALIDPRDGLVRYIGCTCMDVQYRLYFHLRYAGSNPGKFAWIQGLKAEGLEPEVEIIEECHFTVAYGRESYWIAYYTLVLDMPLLNRTKINPRFISQMIKSQKLEVVR